MIQLLKFKFKEALNKYGVLGLGLILIAFVSIFAGVIITYLFFSSTYNSLELINEGETIDSDLTGMIGDFIGGVIGTIWSFAGVILFFLALRLQSKELSLQIKELKDTREVFSTQQFENTFFNLLKTQHDIKQNIELRKEAYDPDSSSRYTKVFKANLAFEEIRKFMYEATRKLDSNLNRVKNGISEKSTLKDEEKKTVIKRFNNAYPVTYDEIKEEPILKSKMVFRQTFGNYQDQLGHYFRNLYHILLYIKENEEEELSIHHWEQLNGKKIFFKINDRDITSEKIQKRYYKYSQFIQAQMSEPELLLVFYDTLFFPKFKKLVDYYNLIENINTNNFIFQNGDLEYYKSFGIARDGKKKSINEIFTIKASI